jgi:hypothetical protein
MVNSLVYFCSVLFRRSANTKGYEVSSTYPCRANVKKHCREEVNPIPSIHDEESGSLRNREFVDEVEDMIRCIPTFESCKVSLYKP